MVKVNEAVVAEFCKNNNMRYHFCMNILFLTTPFGEWYVPLDSNKIELYHGNDNKNGPKRSTNNLSCNYHCQDKEYNNIIDALEYIKVHDFNKIQRSIKRARRRDIFKKLNKVKEKENEKLKNKNSKKNNNKNKRYKKNV